ncbi:MAG: substrate-binding domain-containing protein [Dehalococcoidales bacterium]|nr:substrate-binding domain-containing protein [Dehalococcoidales bacterium]
MRSAVVLLVFLLLAVGCTACGEATTGPEPGGVSSPVSGARLRLATTTSLYDTGLWGYLEPKFEEAHAAQLDILSLGSGQALEYGRRGDVDVLAVHDRDAELKFVADGYGVARVPFAYNYFLIVGPPDDPAGLKGMDPVDAFRRLMVAGNYSFVSRGDNSGTHTREKTIWQQAGYDYALVEKAGSWYIEAGSGMGPTLKMAAEKHAYTLTDIGTYLVYKSRLNLVPVIERGAILLNVYSVIAVNPLKVPGAKNLAMAEKLVSFLTSAEIQEIIGKYGLSEYGRSLFTPCAGSEPSS